MLQQTRFEERKEKRTKENIFAITSLNLYQLPKKKKTHKQYLKKLRLKCF